MIVLTPILLTSLFLLTYEFWALYTRNKLVTTYVREAFAAVPGVFVLMAFVVGFLCGHFFWT